MAGLKRELGFFGAFSIGVGAIIGAGIFVVTGVAAGLAGPALLISLVIAALISAFTAFSFAELAYNIPKEGGGYEFAHELISPPRRVHRWMGVDDIERRYRSGRRPGIR